MDWWTQNKDAITAISLVVGGLITIASAIWAAIKWGFLRRWQRRLRVDVNVFEVITNPTVLLPKLYATENDNSPLADHLVTYQPRDPNRDIQAELKAALNHSRYLLVTAPTGYGKTREAGMLAQIMMLEGWRVLRIKTGWLDIPKTLPEVLNNNRSRILIFLDDLNGLFSIGERTQSPRTEQMPMLNEASYHDRLLQVLDMFEGMCTKSEIRVIATARSEAEQWKLLNFDENDKLWKRFQRIELPGPIDTAIISLLDDSTKQLDLKGNSDDFATIARKSDGTYRNILLNLRRWYAQSKELNKDDFTETLDGSWRDIYENATKKHPAVRYIYDAIDLLQQVGIWPYDFIVEPATLMIWGGNSFQRLIHSIQISLALDYLTKETKILRKAKGDFSEFSPSDGQIEAKGTKIDWSKYILDLEKLILDLEKPPIRCSKLIITYLLFRLGFECLITERNEQAIRIWQRIPTDNLYNWFSEIFSTEMRVFPGWQHILRHGVEQKYQSYLPYFLVGMLLEMFGHVAEAEDVYRQIIAQNPNDAYAQAKLGDILRELERYQEAEKAYCQAIDSDPNYAHAYSRLGSLLRILERYAEAEEAYRKAITKDSSDAFAHFRFGSLLRILERYTEAEEFYRQAISKGLDEAYFPYLYSRLGNVLSKLKRYVEAEEVLRQVVDQSPGIVDPYYELVILLEMNNRAEEALPVLEKLIDLDPENYRHYLNAMSIKKHLGQNIPPEYSEKARSYIPADHWYNLSCLESICDNFDAAFEHLRRATQDKEFNSFSAWEDPDLQWIRSDPRFVEIVGPKPEEKDSEV